MAEDQEPAREPSTGVIPDVHRFLSTASRADLGAQLRARGLPIPADLLRQLESGIRPGEPVPFVHEFLSQASRAHVAAALRDGGRPVPSGLMPAADGLPFVHDLLSEASLAYVARGLADEGREVGSALRRAIARAKRIDRGIRDAITATATAADAATGEGSGTRMPDQVGPYRLLRRLGKGGMGTVYACQREGSGETLAIKVINAGRLADQADRLRFKQEIAVLLRLRHENICRLRDFGQEGSSYWFVMDFVDGQDLGDWCRSAAPAQTVIAATMAMVCRAVGHAHRQGIVHRDLTPANIMILPDGRPMVMDFGLARDLDAGESMTITGMTVGTPPFMAPEQTRGKAGSITRETDVWGAGATLYFLLTGKPPYDGDNTFEVFKAINERMVRRPRDLRQDIEPSLELVILRCLQTDPRDRYGDMDSLARDLEEIAAGRRVRVRLPGLVTTMARQVRRRPLPWLLACALAGTGLGFLGYVASQQIREWGAWTEVAAYRTGAALPAGLLAVDRAFIPQPTQAPGDDGLPPTGDPGDGSLGWWWIDAPGMEGDLRIDAEFSIPTADSLDIAVGARKEPMRDWWHHPAGWGLKLESKDIIGVSARYLDRPGPVTRAQMRLIPGLELDRVRIHIERRDTEMRISVNGSDPVVFDDPLAVGGGGRGLGIRYYQRETRMRHLRIERLALAELVPPVVGGDALVRRGRLIEAVAEYRTVAADHRRPGIAGPALLRALAAACRLEIPDEDLQQAIMAEIDAQGDPGLVDRARRIRAVWLWSQGRHAQAVGIAHDLAARAPLLNPSPAFMADSLRDLTAPVGRDLLLLAGLAPPLGRLSIPNSGLDDLGPLPRRSLLELSVPGNRIRDLGPLRGLGLRVLEAGGNQIHDLSPLAGEEMLMVASLAGNRIADASPLRRSLRLDRLDLSDNPLRSLDGIPPRVRDLAVAGTPVADLSPLDGGRIELLDISGTAITDLGPLATMPRLRRLNISRTAVRDLAPLSGLPLRQVVAQHTRLDAGTLTADLAQLQEVILEDAGLTGTGHLGRFLSPDLRSLALSENPLGRLPPLDLPLLHQARFHQCGLVAAPDLAGVPALRRLTLSDNLISDPTPLADHAFDILDLRRNRIADPGPLLQNPARSLLLSGNPLTPEACARLIDTGLESGRLDLYWQGVSHLLGGRPDPRRWRDHALVVGDSRYAVAYTEPISATEAAAFAAACGGELATPDDPAVAEIIDRSVNQVETFWTGARWTGYQLQDATGRQLRLPADFGWFPSRRAGSLPAVDLPVSVCRPRRWCLRDEHMAEGVIIRFRSR